MGYSPQGRKESDTTERFHFTSLQAPLSIGFSRQEHWNWLPCPPPGDLPDQGLLHYGQIIYPLSYPGSLALSLLPDLRSPRPASGASVGHHVICPSGLGTGFGG